MCKKITNDYERALNTVLLSNEFHIKLFSHRVNGWEEIDVEQKEEKHGFVGKNEKSILSIFKIGGEMWR